jgi:predicted RND superfamily exporter protein
MKTSMQELYSEIEKFKEITDTISITDIQRMIGNYYIEKEKKQIIEAVEETMYEMNLYESFRTLKNGEQYYQETFVDNAEQAVP